MAAHPLTGLPKYTAPRSSHWLKREHLFAQLDRLTESPVVWINAPAGYGKTVLVASYLAERGRPVLWYRIDDRDTDPGAFFHRLHEAACQHGLGAAKRLPALTGEYAGGEQAFARNYIETLCAGVPDGFTLVLDDFQQLPEDAPLQLLLGAILDSVPSSCTVFVLSRHNPPPAVARLRANRQIAELGETELRLDEAETAALVAAWPGGAGSAVPVEALYKRVQGWAAGVVLALEHYRQAGPAEPPEPDIDVIFDYFAAEVVAGLEAGERQLLLATALPLQFDASLAQALSGNSDAAEILHSLLRRNFFIYQEESSYRYHPLFRDFLLQSLQREWRPEQLRQQRLRAATLLLERNEPDMALPLLRDAGDWQRFTGVLLDSAPAMMGQGRHRELERWLREIPEDAADSPWLDFWLAASRLLTDYFASYDLYARAYVRFSEIGDSRGAILAWIGAVDAIIFSLSEVSRLDIWLPHIEPLLSSLGADSDEEIIGQIGSRITSILMLRQPDHPELSRWREIAERAIAGMTDANLRTLSGFYLCTLDIWGGDIERATAFVERTNRAAESLPPLAATANILMQAWLDWTSGREESCRRTFARGVQFAEDTGVRVWNVVLWLQGVTNALIHGAVDEADGYLAQIEPLVAEMRDMDQAYYFIDRAWAELLRGDASQALSYQRRALLAAERFGAVYTLAEAYFGMAQVWHELGDAALAGEHLQQAEALGQRFGSRTMAFQCALARAQFALDGGDREAALKALGEAFAQMRRHGLVMFNGWRSPVMARLCALALDGDVHADLACNLISRFRLMPPEDECSVRWPWRVKVHTLGRFSLEVDGKPVDLSGGKHGRPCALLKHLIAVGAHGIAECHLAEILWPDADGDVAMRNLRTNLHRLRKLLGHDSAVVVVQGRASLNPQACYSDVQTLLHMLDTALVASAAELPVLAEHLLVIGVGEFLPGEEGELIVKRRNQVAGRLSSALHLMAERLRQNDYADLAETLLARADTIEQHSL
jgi:tetratricopeptide (TPR) repeat protein